MAISNRSTASWSPSITASTRPSPRLRTNPLDALKMGDAFREQPEADALNQSSDQIPPRDQHSGTGLHEATAGS